jgi:hypothetical protein
MIQNQWRHDMHSTKQIKWDGPKFMMGWTESNIKNLKALLDYKIVA